MPVRSGPGPNGVAVADGRVYGATPTSVFALNAADGESIWVNRHALTRGEGTFGIQPQAVDGRVYLASQYGIGPGGGVLLALSASTGAVLWKFNTVLVPDPGVESIGAGSGGVWETPLVSTDGSVAFGVGNPYQTPAAAIAHPAAQLYTDSAVNLDAATGKLRWYYQAVPNDFKDYDLQASPIAATAGGVGVVISGGKMGYVYEMDAETGRLMWKTPVVPRSLPVGAATVSNDLVFTTLFGGSLVALNRATGAIVFRAKVPTSTNAPIAIAGNSVIVPAGGPGIGTHHPQVVAYSIR